ncbi:hypothetical protein Vadar_030930 [Vaccinium darrowii]|uniref:Uncharacterized protein n=1 Tax=Vaccinium darrowii TaxID=229202 RepID=A0ACB7YHS0_9ERIC|nr:hypothetical protein Vadar_030930 [Vaccinium darrowii]
MDFPSPIRKSLKSHGSYKHLPKISARGGDDDIYPEERPILSDHHHHGSDMSNDHGHEVVIKIDGCVDDASVIGSGGGGESFYLLPPRREVVNVEDPAETMVGKYIVQQGEEDTELFDHTRKSPTLAESPVLTSKELKVSFQNASDVQPERRYDDEKSSSEDERRYEKSSSEDDDEDEVDKDENQQFYSSAAADNGGGEVLRCTSFQRQSMLRTRPKSRLVDPPQPDPRSGPFLKSGQLRSGPFPKSSQLRPGQFPKSGQLRSGPFPISGQLRSGLLGRASGMLGKHPEGEEDDDPFFDEDLPEELTKSNLNALIILQWVSLVLIVAALSTTLAIPAWRKKELRDLQWWKWEVLVLVLICGRLVSGWGIRIIVLLIERNFLLRKRVLYFVYGVRMPVQNCIWLGLVLVAWHYLFDKRVEPGTNKKFLKLVNKILWCLLVGALVWLGKTLMVKVLASLFHVSTFFDRIQESLFNQYVIETLSGPPLIEIQSIREDEERTLNKKSPRAYSKRQDDEGIPIEHLHRMTPKNVSAWNMKRLVNIVRHRALSTLDEQVLESTNGDESATQIRSEFEAKVAARKIFRNVAMMGFKFIYLEDIMRFMREDEALKTIALLGGSHDCEKIRKSALKNWVVNAFRERRALALTLNDTKTAVNKLHQMVNVLVGLIIVILCLLILGIATIKFLLSVSSQIVVVAFVFGNTCKTVFEAIVFLFVLHPFDVGDRCEIDGVQMIVEEMNILTTIFLRYDNQKISYPNSTLSTKPIGNYYRSPDMGDSIEFSVHIATPGEKIAMMRQRIKSFIESKKDHWYASPTVILMNVEELNKLKMAVWMQHKINHQDMGEKWLRRAQVVEEMIKIFRELDIGYRLLPLDINICSMPNTPNSTRMPTTWLPPINEQRT